MSDWTCPNCAHVIGTINITVPAAPAMMSATWVGEPIPSAPSTSSKRAAASGDANLSPSSDSPGTTPE